MNQRLEFTNPWDMFLTLIQNLEDENRFRILTVSAVRIKKIFKII